jgi:hypothetical protein
MNVINLCEATTPLLCPVVMWMHLKAKTIRSYWAYACPVPPFLIFAFALSFAPPIKLTSGSALTVDDVSENDNKTPARKRLSLESCILESSTWLNVRALLEFFITQILFVDRE